MIKAYQFHQGQLPLLISMPHSGLAVTDAVKAGLVDEALELNDTDWHIPELYQFAKGMGASVLQANYSRYVIDLNRPADNVPLYQTATTGLYPETLFNGHALFKPEQKVSKRERQEYLQQIWSPYHEKIQIELTRIKQQFGYALLWDAHSIRSEVPYLFEGKLPDFNIGTNSGLSCHPTFERAIMDTLAQQQTYSHVANGRFKGGYITRHYGQPEQDIHAVQLEMAQYIYMNEDSYAYMPEHAAPAIDTISQMLNAYLNAAERHYSK